MSAPDKISAVPVDGKRTAHFPARPDSHPADAVKQRKSKAVRPLVAGEKLAVSITTLPGEPPLKNRAERIRAAIRGQPKGCTIIEGSHATVDRDGAPRRMLRMVVRPETLSPLSEEVTVCIQAGTSKKFAREVLENALRWIDHPGNRFREYVPKASPLTKAVDGTKSGERE